MNNPRKDIPLPWAEEDIPSPAPSSPAPAQSQPEVTVKPEPEAVQTPPEEPKKSTRSTSSDEAGPSRRGAPVASGGKRIDVAEMPSTPQEVRYPSGYVADEYAVDENVDYNDLMTVNRDLIRARSRLFRATRILAEAQREEAAAKTKYKSAINRQLVMLSGGSEKQRQAIAEVQCEDLIGEWVVADRVADEALNHLRAVRSDLDALDTLSNNIRAQMKIM
jgi:hypothetical protein